MKYSIIGTGNVAWHLTQMLSAAGHQCLQMGGRSPHAEEWMQGSYTQDLDRISTENDVVFVAVKDDAIAEVSSKLHPALLVVHMSGATTIDVIQHTRRGVVWPIQSMRKGVVSDHTLTPFLVDGSSPEIIAMLLHVFQAISQTTFAANDRQRAQAHMATVFANNFTTQLLEITRELLAEQNLPLSISLPSVRDLMQKLYSQTPLDVQTGPARRADMKTLNNQLTLLENHPEYKELYTYFTNRILKTFHDKQL